MEKCGENETSFYYKKDGSCKKLAGNINGEEKSKNYMNGKLLTLHLSEGDLCSNGQNYQINFEFECNSEAEYIKQGTLSVDLSSIDPSKCIQTFTVKGVREACEIANFYALYHFFEEHKFLVGIIIIIIGLFLTFLGKKLEEVTVVLVSDLVVPGVLLIILYNIFSVTQTWIPWVVIIIGILLGIGLGIFLLKLKNIFGAVLSGTLGYIVGLLLYNAFLSKIQSNPSVVYWITIVVCIIVCAILGYALYSYFLIIGTAIVGAYVAIRGISLLAGGFPSESLVIDLIQKKEWDELKQFSTAIVYAYLAGFVVLSVIGIVVQFKFFGKKETKNNDNNSDREKMMNN